MIKCADGCVEACDHCRHYDFNGEPVKSADGTQTVIVYVGKGHCRRRNEQWDPGDFCEDFHCRRAEEANPATGDNHA